MSKFAEITKNSFTDFHENRRSVNQFDISWMLLFFSSNLDIDWSRKKDTNDVFIEVCNYNSF